jgi:hypothetical protein
MSEFYAVLTGDIAGTDLAEKTFYGFKQDPRTGSTKVEVIADGSKPIVFPDRNAPQAGDYRQFVITDRTLGLQTDARGHLILTIY